MKMFPIHTQQLAALCRQNIVGEFITKVTFSSGCLFYFHFTNKKEKFVICTQPNNIIAAFIDINNDSIDSDKNKFINFLNASYNRMKITSVVSNNEDNILTFGFESIDKIYQKRNFFLVIELIAKQFNIIVLDDNKKILYAINYSDLTSHRPILRGSTYTYPTKPNNFSNVEKDFYTDSEIRLFLSSITEQYKLKFDKKLKKNILNKLHFCEKLIKNIESDIDDLKDYEKYKREADYLQIYKYDMEQCENFDTISTNSIEINDQLTIQENITALYNKYKKAKVSLQHLNKRLEQAKEQMNSIKFDLENFEDKKDEVYEKYGEFIPQQNKKHKQDDRIFPFSATLNNTNVLFGKNSLQNDYLSFNIGRRNKSWLWFHINLYKGSHAVLCKEMPTNDEILFAAEIALLASHKEQGEVNYTQIKNIRKTTKIGSVLMNKKQSIYVSKIREKSLHAFSKSKKHL